MRDTLQTRDGKLYVVSRDTKWDEPVMVERWYPTGLRAFALEEYGIEDGAELLGDTYGDGLYEVIRSNRAMYGARAKVRLENGGATVPEFVETEPVPAPKARVKTRWSCGQWEKLLAAKGWVAA